MKKWITGFVLVVSALAVVGWGSAPTEKSEKSEHQIGEEQANRMRQQNDENIKRAEGDWSGLRDIREQGPLQNDERGRW